jgi:hypothetical protein
MNGFRKTIGNGRKDRLNLFAHLLFDKSQGWEILSLGITSLLDE